MKKKLNVIVVSTRPGRMGLPIAQWFMDRAREHAGFEPVLVDLKEFALPLFDEPKHPRLGQYEHEHTKLWSASVASGDAFVFVTPEYNFSAPPSLLNAIDFVFREWAYKPAGFVSYGGVSGGLRGVQMSKLALTSVKVMPMVEAVTIPSFSTHFQDGAFAPPAPLADSAKAMLDELVRWADALRPLRGA
ncbi:MAG: NADPH-dependent FMN reductase [Polyangiaceae bacterium]